MVPYLWQILYWLGLRVLFHSFPLIILQRIWSQFFLAHLYVNGNEKVLVGSDSISKFTGTLLPLQCDWHGGTRFDLFAFLTLTWTFSSHTTLSGPLRFYSQEFLLALGFVQQGSFCWFILRITGRNYTSPLQHFQGLLAFIHYRVHRSFLKFSQCPQTGPLGISVTSWWLFLAFAPRLSPDRSWHNACLVPVIDLSPCAQIWELMRHFISC